MEKRFKHSMWVNVSVDSHDDETINVEVPRFFKYKTKVVRVFNEKESREIAWYTNGCFLIDLPKTNMLGYEGCVSMTFFTQEDVKGFEEITQDEYNALVVQFFNDKSKRVLVP